MDLIEIARTACSGVVVVLRTVDSGRIRAFDVGADRDIVCRKSDALAKPIPRTRVGGFQESGLGPNVSAPLKEIRRAAIGRQIVVGAVDTGARRVFVWSSDH